MSNLKVHIDRGIAATAAITVLLGLAGCGGSGEKPGSHNSAAEGRHSNSPGSAAASAAKKLGIPPKMQRAAARVGVITLSSCLRGHGVKVPPQNLSSAQPVFNLKGIDTKSPRVAVALHTCVSLAEAAYKDRLASDHVDLSHPGAPGRAQIPPATRLAAARVGLITLTKCLQQHGIKMPPQPVTSSHPVLNLKGINPKSASYEFAYNACLPKLSAAYSARLRKG